MPFVEEVMEGNGARLVLRLMAWACRLDELEEVEEREGDGAESDESGGNTNEPWRVLPFSDEPALPTPPLPALDPAPGNGFATVSLGLQSTVGRMRVGRKVRRAGRCGAKRVG
jgi:hypothetical protein